MSKELPSELMEMLEEGRIDINIRETPWGEKEMMVSDKTSDKYSISSDLFDSLYEFLENQRELVLEVDKVESKYDGIDRFWHLGRLAERYVGEGGEISNGEFAVLSQVGDVAEGTFVGQMREIYNTFPNQEYSDGYFSPSTMAELMQIDGLESDDIRKLNSKAKKMDVYVDKEKMRTIRYILRRDSLGGVVEECMEKKIYEQMTAGNAINTLQVTYKLLDREPDDEEIERLVKDSKMNSSS